MSCITDPIRNNIGIISQAHGILVCRSMTVTKGAYNTRILIFAIQTRTLATHRYD